MEPEEAERVTNRCPECGEVIDVSDLPPFSKVNCPYCEQAVRLRVQVGKYDIQRLLGVGGMSQVFVAHDTVLDRLVALKILHHALSKDAALMAMFEREAKHTASVNHPNVVKVYTAGSDGGYFYIAMELVDSVSLDEMIHQQGMLPEKRVLEIALGVSNGLRAAQQNGLIHRDIKPGNMLVAPDGTVKLVDFGIALATEGDDLLTETWATPFYVPPEKLEGQPDDFRGDIYSLGATLFHAARGKPPFEANTNSLDELKEIKAAPISLKDCAPHLSASGIALIDRMMAHNPKDRFKNYDALITAVEKALERHLSPTTRLAAPPPAPAPAWHKWVFIGAGLLVAIVVAALTLTPPEGQGDLDQTLTPDTEARVVSSGERTVSARFNEARSALLAGQFAEAEKSFHDLYTKTELKQPTWSWARFNAGLARLFQGDETGARDHFQRLLADAPPAVTGEAPPPECAYLKALAQPLAAPLPVGKSIIEESAGGEFRPIGLLACGLKSWEMHQFTQARETLARFSAAAPSGDFGWMAEAKPLAALYLADAERMQALPKPSMAMSAGDLEALKAPLEAAKEAMRSGKTARAFVSARLDRIPAIIQAQAERERLHSAAATPPAPAPSPSLAEVPEPPPFPEPPTSDGDPAVAKDLSTLREWLTAQRPDLDRLLFRETAQRLGELKVESSTGSLRRDDLLHSLGKCEELVDRVKEELALGQYKGPILRREGSPLDGAITGLTDGMLLVDLGFGSNQVSFDQMSAPWLLQVAGRTYLRPGLPSATPEACEAAAWYARVLQLGASEEAQWANRVGSSLEGFAQRWARTSPEGSSSSPGTPVRGTAGWKPLNPLSDLVASGSAIILEEDRVTATDGLASLNQHTGKDAGLAAVVFFSNPGGAESAVQFQLRHDAATGGHLRLTVKPQGDNGVEFVAAHVKSAAPGAESVQLMRRVVEKAFQGDGGIRIEFAAIGPWVTMRAGRVRDRIKLSPEELSGTGMALGGSQAILRLPSVVLLDGVDPADYPAWGKTLIRDPAAP